MKVERLRVEPCRRRLRREFRTGLGAISERRGFVIEIESAGGGRGLGEALPLPALGSESLDACRLALETARDRIVGRPGSVEALAQRLEQPLHAAPAARFALETALYDLAGQEAARPLAQLLSRIPRASLAVNAMLPVAKTAQTVEAARAACARGFGTLKLKVGAGPAHADVERLRAVRQAIGPGRRIRIDANGVWNVTEALRILEQLAPIGIEFVEQPVPADDLDGLARLRRCSPIPVAADEVLVDPARRLSVLRDALADILVLKPMLLGGLRSCLEIASLARRHGLRCLVTTTLDGPIATAAALHLAAAVGTPGLASGLASSDWIEAEFPAGLIPVRGRLSLPGAPGLGLDPSP